MNVFDIIGPVMIGPSSSHTAGAVRIGLDRWCVAGRNCGKSWKIGSDMDPLPKPIKGMVPIRLWSLVSWEWNPATGESGRVWFWPIDKEWRFLFMRCILTVLIPIRR